MDNKKTEKNKKQNYHIAIAGNIGSGKTTLTKLLSKKLKWEPRYEEIDDNPYINDFYNDMKRWSFNLQIYFLNKRLSEIIEINKTEHSVIQDRTIYEDAQIFAPNLQSMGLMSSRDFENYFKLFQQTISLIKPPDLIIYLRSSVSKLVAQIQKRGRVYESSIRLDYLQRLNNQYEEWAKSYDAGKILIIDIDDHDFENNPEDLRYIIDSIHAQLHGLF